MPRMSIVLAGENERSQERRRFPPMRRPHIAERGEAMGIFLSKRELAETEPAEKVDFKSPVPTRMVSNGEFNPLPQTQRQRQFEARLKDFSEASARKLGMD